LTAAIAAHDVTSTGTAARAARLREDIEALIRG
jgi:hypothetical protein